jgi:hypothetical protein
MLRPVSLRALGALTLMFLVLCFTCGCGEDSAPEIRMDLAIEPNADGTHLVTATIRNDGAGPAQYTVFCVETAFVRFEARGPMGEIQLKNPCVAEPTDACLLGPEELDPGETIADDIVVPAIQWSLEDCSPQPLPRGDYLLTAEFYYQGLDDPENLYRVVGQTVRFEVTH